MKILAIQGSSLNRVNFETDTTCSALASWMVVLGGQEKHRQDKIYPRYQTLNGILAQHALGKATVVSAPPQTK